MNPWLKKKIKIKAFSFSNWVSVRGVYDSTSALYSDKILGSKQESTSISSYNLLFGLKHW